MKKQQQLAITISASLAITMMAAAGCANKQTELEPRTDVRPMINTIHQAEQDWLWIAARKWHLILIESHAPIAGTTLNLSFKEHTWLTGDAGCNHFTANYTRKSRSRTPTQRGSLNKKILCISYWCHAARISLLAFAQTS